MKKLNVLLFLCFGLSYSALYSQDKPVVVEDNKVIVVKKKVDENGNVTLEKIVKEGDGAHEILKDMDYNIEIDTDIEDDGTIIKKRYKVIKSDQDGEEVIEWNGEGEMPDEIKKQLEEENVFIHQIGEDHDGIYEIEIESESINGEDEEKEIKVIIKSNDGDKTIEWLADGEKEFSDENVFIIDGDNIEIAGEETIHVKVDVEEIDGLNKTKIIIERDGEEPEVIEWEGEGEMPDEIKRKLEQYDVHMLQGDETIEVEVNGLHEDHNKAFLGVHIENAKTGARILKVEENSSAKLSGLKEGDIITAINDNKVDGIESLLAALKPFLPEEEITISYTREGVNSQVKSVLQERPISHNNVWISKDHEKFHKDKNVFFFSDGEDQKIAKKKVIIIKKDVNDEGSKEEKLKFPEIQGKELKLTGFNAFPNPTNDVINVSFVAEKSPIFIQIFDISGKEVYKKEIQDFDGYFNEDISLRDQVQGNYILYVVQNEAVFSKNIILN